MYISLLFRPPWDSPGWVKRPRLLGASFLRFQLLWDSPERVKHPRLLGCLSFVFGRSGTPQSRSNILRWSPSTFPVLFGIWCLILKYVVVFGCSNILFICKPFLFQPLWDSPEWVKHPGFPGGVLGGRVRMGACLATGKMSNWRVVSESRTWSSTTIETVTFQQ